MGAPRIKEVLRVEPRRQIRKNILIDVSRYKFLVFPPGDLTYHYPFYLQEQRHCYEKYLQVQFSGLFNL